MQCEWFMRFANSSAVCRLYFAILPSLLPSVLSNDSRSVNVTPLNTPSSLPRPVLRTPQSSQSISSPPTPVSPHSLGHITGNRRRRGRSDGRGGEEGGAGEGEEGYGDGNLNPNYFVVPEVQTEALPDARNSIHILVIGDPSTVCTGVVVGSIGLLRKCVHTFSFVCFQLLSLNMRVRQLLSFLCLFPFCRPSRNFFAAATHFRHVECSHRGRAHLRCVCCVVKRGECRSEYVHGCVQE